jgi:hypothetical protein
MDDNPPPHSQPGWKWCKKCQGLFYARNPSKGVCPVDHSPHDDSASESYFVMFNIGDGRGQTGWKWCGKCQGLFYDLNPTKGICPADGQAHDPTGPNTNYVVGFDPTPPPPPPTDMSFNIALASDLPLGGGATVAMKQNGDFTFSGFAHDSGLDNIDYVLSTLIWTADGQVFVYQHAGHTEGTSAGLPFGTPNRDDNFAVPGSDLRITKEWDGIVNGRIAGDLTGKDTFVSGIEGTVGSIVGNIAQTLEKSVAELAVSFIVAV